MTYAKQRKGWRMSCELCSFSNLSVASPTSQLILQTFPLLHLRHSSFSNSSFASPTSTHSATFPSLHLRHSSFSNPSLASPTSQFILQHFFRFSYVCSFSNISVTSAKSQRILQPFRSFTYVTAHSPTLPLRHLRHSSYSNPSFSFPTSQALHLCHLASRPSSVLA